MPVLAVAHELRGQRLLAAPGTAQGAHDALLAVAVEVHVLARQRRAPAVGASVAVGLQCPEALAQEHALELFDIVCDR
jgi:hypothetical protein